jgi:hypothetical protein
MLISNFEIMLLMAGVFESGFREENEMRMRGSCNSVYILVEVLES